MHAQAPFTSTPHGATDYLQADLRGLDERLREETGMPIQLADNPLESVVLGAGKCVEDFDALQQVLVPDRRR